MQIWPLMNCLELKKVEPQHEEGPREWQTWANYIRNREVPLYESFFSPHILLLLTRRPLYKALCYIEVLLYMDFEHLEFALLLTCILFSLGRTILSIVFQNICYQVIIANNWKCEFKKVYRVLCIVRGTLGMIILRLSLKGGFFSS